MAPKKTRIKSAAAVVDVPQNRESAAAAIAAIGTHSRDLARINADMNDALAQVKEQYERLAEPFRQKIESLTNGLQMYAEANATLSMADKFLLGFMLSRLGIPSSQSCLNWLGNLRKNSSGQVRLATLRVWLCL